MYNGVPRSWGIFENFCVKNNLTVCKATFECKLREKMGEQDVLVAPPIILLGEQLLPQFPCLWPKVCPKNCGAFLY